MVRCRYKNICLTLGKDHILAHLVTWKLKRLIKDIQFCCHKPDWNMAQRLRKNIQWFQFTLIQNEMPPQTAVSPICKAVYISSSS